MEFMKSTTKKTAGSTRTLAAGAWAFSREGVWLNAAVWFLFWLVSRRFWMDGKFTMYVVSCDGQGRDLPSQNTTGVSKVVKLGHGNLQWFKTNRTKSPFWTPHGSTHRLIPGIWTGKISEAGALTRQLKCLVFISCGLYQTYLGALQICRWYYLPSCRCSSFE